MAAKKEHRVEIRNKKASFDYEFLETYEAGISLMTPVFLIPIFEFFSP